MESEAAIKKPSAMANLNAIAKTNWITGATINRKEPEPNIRRFIPKRTITGKLKPDEPELQAEAESNTWDESKAETVQATAMRLGQDGVMMEENDDSYSDANDGSNYEDSDESNHEDNDESNHEDNDDSDDEDSFDSESNTVPKKIKQREEFTSKNNVYFDGYGYARRVGKEDDCYIEFSLDGNTLVIKWFICLEGGKLLLYHMIKDLEEKGEDFTDIRLIPTNLDPNPFDPNIFNPIKKNKLKLKTIKDLKAKKYIDEDDNFTKKYYDMIPNGYVVKKHVPNGNKVTYEFTPKYYRDMKRKVNNNYKAMGFEDAGNGEFIGTTAEIEATLESILGIRGGAKKRKTKRKQLNKTKRKPKYYKKTKRKPKHYKKTKRRTKK